MIIVIYTNFINSIIIIITVIDGLNLRKRGLKIFLRELNRPIILSPHNHQ